MDTRRDAWGIAAVLSLIVGLIGPAVQAEPSLNPKDRIDHIAVAIHGVTEHVTVLRDAGDPHQWYYIPNRVRLAEREVNGRREPELTLVRFRLPDPDKPGATIEAGILQFAATLGLPPEAIRQITEALGKKHAGDHRVSPMPLTSAEVSLYTPQTGKVLASAGYAPAAGPLFTTQRLAFSLELPKIDRDFLVQLKDGKIGVPAAVTLTYRGVLPPVGYSIKVDWERTYRYYRDNRRFRDEAAHFGWFGATREGQEKTILAELTDSNCIEVEIDEGSGLTLDAMTPHAQMIVKRINDELIETVGAPSAVDLGPDSTLSKEEFLSPAGFTVALKEVSKTKNSKELLHFNTQGLQDRRDVATGALGLSAYSASLRNKLVPNTRF